MKRCRSYIEIILHFFSFPEFRLQVYKEYPIVVDYYYKIGETLNSDYKGREIDQAIWTQEKKI